MKISAQERLFEPFMDPVDGVLCIPAESDASAIQQQTAPHGLRFPLLLDRSSSLSHQVASSAFTPASSRFGPYCDNITGMNWEMPDGRKVRIGERVVKSTTGYDLLRFMLGTGNRYGRPLDYVLRLRPLCDVYGVFKLSGDIPQLRKATSSLLAGSWIHWFESVDFIVGKNHTPSLRISAHCPEVEWDAYWTYLTDTAARFNLSLLSEKNSDAVYDGCPDFAIKTSPEFLIDTALNLASHPGVICIAFCYCAAIHVFLPTETDKTGAIQALTQPLAGSLHSIGGDWHSRHLPSAIPSPVESRWLATLMQEWQIS